MIEHHCTSRDEWLAMRRKHIGASEVASLFGMQPPYAMSKWTLWHVMAGHLPEPKVDGERPAWGLRLEDAIMVGAAAENGWYAYRRAGYVQHETIKGFGCSPDFFLTGRNCDPTEIIETKNTDWLVHRQQWGDEPPPHILLQIMAQLSCTGLPAVTVASLVGGNKLKTYRYERRPKTIAEIERRVIDFLDSIRTGHAPPVDGSESTFAALRLLYPADNGEFVHMGDDDELVELCHALMSARELRKNYEHAEREARNGILAKVGAYSTVYCNEYTITATTINPQLDRVITQAMVGETIKGRAGGRTLRVRRDT